MAKAASSIANSAYPEHELLASEVRSLRERYQAAVARELALEAREGDPGFADYTRALEHSEALAEGLDRLGVSILRRPLKSWADVVVLAELMQVHVSEGEVSATERAIEIMTALLEGVLQLGAKRD
jgi:hypothetical protein